MEHFIDALRAAGGAAIAACAFGAGPCLAGQLPADSVLAQQATRFLTAVAQRQGLDGTLQASFTDAGGERMRACPDPEITRGTQRPLEVYETLQVSCPGTASLAGVTYLRAQITLQGAYPVTDRSIDRGEVITRADLRTRRGDLLRLPQDARAPIDTWVGQIATQRIPAGEPLRGSEVRGAQSVARGQDVHLIYEAPGLRVSNDGTAISSAGVGSVVQVKTDGGRIVAGRVAADGSVRVQF